MARKQRRLEQVATAANETKEKARYQDPFQSTVGQKIEDAGKVFEGKGKTLIYGVAGLAVLAILIGIFYQWNRSTTGKAQTALAKAIEISQSRVTDAPVPAGSTEKTYKTEKDRADAAITAFQDVVDKFGGATGDKAKYFIAVNRLTTDRAAGILELEGLAKGSSDVSKLSKFALAQTKAEDGKFDESAALYKELAAMSDPIVAKDTINFQLAKLYEKQGKKQDAVDLYFSIAKSASEAKDADGKAIPMGETARDAKDKVTQLDPEKAKDIKESQPENPFGGPIGM
jgi:tetratricopeptide (TPR) repeat protein